MRQGLVWRKLEFVHKFEGVPLLGRRQQAGEGAVATVSLGWRHREGL